MTSHEVSLLLQHGVKLVEPDPLQERPEVPIRGGR
jgi:hypothetical protein